MMIMLAIGLVASVALPAFGADFSNDRLLVTGSGGKLFDFSGNTLGTTGGGLRGSAYLPSTDQYAIFNSDDANTNLYSSTRRSSPPTASTCSVWRTAMGSFTFRQETSTTCSIARWRAP